MDEQIIKKIFSQNCFQRSGVSWDQNLSLQPFRSTTELWHPPSNGDCTECESITQQKASKPQKVLLCPIENTTKLVCYKVKKKGGESILTQRELFEEKPIWCINWVGDNLRLLKLVYTNFVQIFKGSLKWAFSLGLCDAGTLRLDPKTLTSLGRDNDTHIGRPKHRAVAPKPFVSRSWSTDLAHCWRTVKG